MSHLDVTSQTLIDRPVDEVARYLINPERTPDWSDHVSGVWWLSEPTLAVGSRLEYLTHLLGKPMEFRCRVTSFDPTGEFVVQSEDGPVPLTLSYRWSVDDTGATWVELRHQADLTGLRGLGSPVAAPQVRHAQEHDLAKLKRLVETTTA